MATFLSAEWMTRYGELSREVPEAPGASARLQQVVTGAPDGDVAYYAVVEDGRVRELGLGRVDDADVTLTGTYGDVAQMVRGDLDPAVAFMQGRLKVAGSMAPVLRVLPLADRPECRAVRQELAALTEF